MTNLENLQYEHLSQKINEGKSEIHDIYPILEDVKLKLKKDGYTFIESDNRLGKQKFYKIQ